MQIAGKPSLTLQEIKEYDTTHHLLDIIARQFIIFLKGCKVLGIRISSFLLHPFVSLLYIFLARKELHELCILFTIFIKEIEERLEHSGRENRIYFIYFLLLEETTIKIRRFPGQGA